MKRLSIKLHRTTFLPGERVSGSVILEADKVIDIRSFYMEIVGYERTRIHHGAGRGGGNDTGSHDHIQTTTFLYKRKELSSEGSIQPGTCIMDFEFDLPKMALPSYTGKNGRISYSVNARADVPLWFDLKATEAIGVIPSSLTYTERPVTLNVGYPSEFKPGKPLAKDRDKPGFFLQLKRTHFRPGEMISGLIWVNNPTAKRIRKIDVHLRGKERVRAQGHTETSNTDRYSIQVPFDGPLSNTPLPFQLSTSREATTSIDGALIRYFWNLEVNLDVAWAFDRAGSVGIFLVL